jgi:uncharacterized coiled-coil DUF342 family protein
MSDKYDEQTEKILPCRCDCSLTYRPAVAAALRENGEELATVLNDLTTMQARANALRAKLKATEERIAALEAECAELRETSACGRFASEPCALANGDKCNVHLSARIAALEAERDHWRQLARNGLAKQRELVAELDALVAKPEKP